MSNIQVTIPVTSTSGGDGYGPYPITGQFATNDLYGRIIDVTFTPQTLSSNGAIEAIVAESASFAIPLGTAPGNLYQVTTGSSTITATLPTGAPSAWYCFIRKTDSGTGHVITSPVTSPAATAVYVQGHMTMLFTDGTSWFARPWFGSIDASGNITETAYNNFTITATNGAITLASATTTPAQFTSTLVTGTSPFVVASTTNVANLNASSLSGATFSAPGPIGSGTASTGAFTTLSASSTVSGAGFSTYLASPPAIGGTAAAAGSFTTVAASTSVLSTGTGGVGYAVGAGGAVTQLTSRTTGVTINKPSGTITMFSAAGSATAATFTVTNSTVALTDTVDVVVQAATNLYNVLVTTVTAGSFNITFYTTGGTATDAPILNFTVRKGVAS